MCDYRTKSNTRSRRHGTSRGGFFCFRGLHIRPVWRVLNQNLKRFQFCFRRNLAFLRRKKLNQQGYLVFELTAISFALFSIYPEKWKILTSAKTRLLKGFYNFSPRVHETHERPRQAADFAGIILRIGPNSEIFCRFCRPPGETSDFSWYPHHDWSIEIMNTHLFMPFFRVSLFHSLSAFSSWEIGITLKKTPIVTGWVIHVPNSILSCENADPR